MAAVDPILLQPGDALAHYRIEKMIGGGAMGVVYRAHDLSLDRTVGLKVLREEVSKDVRFVGRFLFRCDIQIRWIAEPFLGMFLQHDSSTFHGSVEHFLRRDVGNPL